MSEAQEDKDRLEEALSRARDQQRTLEETSRNKQVRPPLNKKLFPVYRPGGSKRANWNLFFHLFKEFFFFFLLFPLYILV